VGQSQELVGRVEVVAELDRTRAELHDVEKGEELVGKVRLLAVLDYSELEGGGWHWCLLVSRWSRRSVAHGSVLGNLGYVWHRGCKTPLSWDVC